MTRPYKLAALAILCLLFVAGCSSERETESLIGSNDSPPGHLRIDLMDAPFPLELIESTSVTIQGVILHYTTEFGSSGFQVIRRNEMTMDLLELQNGVTETLLDDQVSAGKITQIRLLVEKASVTLAGGRTLDVLFPSGLESGVKVFPEPHIQVSSQLTTELLLDFDLSRSFLPIPKAADEVFEVRHFLFKPALRVVDRSETGTLSGAVLDSKGTSDFGDDTPLGHAAVMAFLGEDEVTSTSTDAEGLYKLMGLSRQLHTLVAFARGYEPDTLLSNVMIANDLGGNDFRLNRIQPN
jgi:hypothetical protein